MSSPINNPDIPYLSSIEEGLSPSKLIRIQGAVPETGQRFNINLQCGPNVSPRDDIALHVSVRLAEGYVARNTLNNQMWGDEQGEGYLAIAPGQQFEIIILCDQTQYKIAINGQHFCEFPHRIPYHRVSHLAIDGDVSIKLINYENAGAPRGQGVGEGGAPQMGGYQQPPMGQYGPPLGQGYGPGQYGPGPYGPPPPPGANPDGEKSSGFEDFLSSPGGAIAASLGTSLLQGVLSGSNKPNQPQGPQQYGQQQPQQPQEPLGALGSIGSLLTDALAGGNKPPQQPQQSWQQPQHGPQEQLGALGSIGSLLTDALAGGHKPQQQPQMPWQQQPQQGPLGGGYGGQSVGGLGSIGSLLTDALVNSVVSPKQPHKQN